MATDLPGRFPTASGQGDSYVMVMYDFDSNTINAVAIKNRKKESLIKGYNEMYEDLQKAGINPVLHWLDNETSKELTGLQLMPHICGTKKGSFFKRGIFPSKIGTKDFYWDTIQALPKTRVFLYT
jgi:hypothetical protein